MTDTHGLVLVCTGNGKGKTTAALGLAIRAWGGGAKVLILQFIKGGGIAGELKAIEQMAKIGGAGKIALRQLGLGFTQKGDDPAPHQMAAARALDEARSALDGAWDMVILDEVLYAVKFGLLDPGAVLELIALRPPQVHLVLTGRDAPPDIVACADLVTEMREVKHPYARGIPAQRWIEF